MVKTCVNCIQNLLFIVGAQKMLEYGIDISIVKDVDEPQSNVVPMIRYLEAVPMGVPDWAVKKRLVA